MKIEGDIKRVLSGEEFDKGVVFRLAGDNEFVERNQFLVKKLSGAKVLHVGFVDHLELIQKKRSSKNWLHDHLVDCTSRVVGVDINETGVDMIRKMSPHYEMVVHDVISEAVPKLIADEEWDYVLLADVIEHVDSPVDFLRSFASKYNGLVDRIAITTPNAFSMANLLSGVLSREVINSDHRYWFTPYTLAKVASIAGLTDIQLRTVEHGRVRKRNFTKRYLLNKFPLWMNTLYLEAAVG